MCNGFNSELYTKRTQTNRGIISNSPTQVTVLGRRSSNRIFNDNMDGGPTSVPRRYHTTTETAMSIGYYIT